MSNTTNEAKIIEKRLIITLAVIATIIIIIAVNGLATVERTNISAPCHIIQSDDYDLPNNVITKGYDVIRTTDPNTDKELVTYDCYYIKSTTLIERLVYNW